MNLRKIQAADNAILATIIRSAFEEFDAPKTGTVYSDATTDDLFTLFRQERSVLWVAEIDGAVVGCCGIYPTPGLPPDYAELVKFYLSKDARGLGVGRALMEQCTQSAVELGYTHLYLESQPKFGNAVRIYEKQGYQLLDQPLGQSGHTSCDIWMVKELG
ncbi:GNAT family N-acetyltransferase [Niabella hibiscisoli]|uniref:GNAT family N-acetyltransferase n=1 Tax=Niabella hibiscisoli TaxID=1825928 RepID=UPI001F101DF0|nr:GNAT family N-acetyltransferase [Niabella hibiscisoli]MCH5715363.1 GNAT family N-acetyltransferase [Niabella hibiscisoli]